MNPTPDTDHDTELDTAPTTEAPKADAEPTTEPGEPEDTATESPAIDDAESPEGDAPDVAEDAEPDADAEAVGEEPAASDDEDAGEPDEADDAEPEGTPAKKTAKKTAKKSSRSKKTTKKTPAKASSKVSAKDKPDKIQMVINYVPGEECRVAFMHDAKLEEYHAERTSTANRVGNIYHAKVANVESAIQAAFVDFGQGENAFLHITDLHPRYFPAEDESTTERIGKKTSRRERPPIQACLKKGQKITVQVLKDGVGTKGPAVTSYLSIPGRYLVMMPHMDKVGVSRKVEDDDLRKRMRAILDQLELPDGFGFILRTAGLERTKTELKRDLAYLQRLWKDMERRQKKAGKPTLLYAESDLLVRTLRDNLTAEVDEVVIDDEAGLRRAANFLKIVAPRSRQKLLHYPGPWPVFHAFGIEDQLQRMHARQVSLPSGGALVFDETEALVAIDVNSGKSRSARDAETNAFETNKEAADEICRQLKLRELGGLVVCDLIDMRDAKHRRAIEGIFKDRLKSDRARSTVLPISQFGIMEITRQRVKASHSSEHYAPGPHYAHRGLVRKPESLASDAMRETTAVAAREKVARVELVVPSRVAAELLSHRRRSLSRIERMHNVVVDVRVSDAIGPERFTVYAYDETGSDIEVDRLPKMKTPTNLRSWEAIAEESDGADWAADVDPSLIEDPDAEADAEAAREIEESSHPIELGDDGLPDEDDEAPRKKRKRRRRRKKKTDSDTETGSETEAGEGEETAPDAEDSDDEAEDSEDRPKKKRRRRGRRGRRKSEDGTDADAEDTADGEAGESEPSADGEATDDADGPKKKRRRRRGRGKSSEGGDAESGGSGDAEPPVVETPKSPKPRLLYTGARRRLKTSELPATERD